MRAVNANGAGNWGDGVVASPLQAGVAERVSEDDISYYDMPPPDDISLEDVRVLSDMMVIDGNLSY